MSGLRARPLIGAGAVRGDALVLTAPISFWGGVDPASGMIQDPGHPQAQEFVCGKVLFVPATIGSSSASMVLLELVHAGRAPAAIVLHEADAILLLGLVAARELGLSAPPALQLDRKHYGAIGNGPVLISDEGLISRRDDSDL